MQTSVPKKAICYVFFSVILFFSCKKDKPALPSLTTAVITEISYTTATSGGDITNDGGTPIISKGTCWNTSSEPTIANSKTTEEAGSGAFISKLTQLNPNTTYYVRAYATNSAGTNYGNQVMFTTNPVGIPALTTAEITSVTNSSAVSGGTITAENGGSISVKGICWSTSENPTVSDNKTSDGSGSTAFVSSLTSLNSNTKYYVRAYAANNAGTAYGNQLSFTTEPLTSVDDIEGNVYKIVTIGTQTWMAENLKVTKFNDGTSIPTNVSTSNWYYLTTPAYCWYNDSIKYKDVYGALYNWYTVGTGKLCPEGWHVPTDAEWTTMTNYIGGLSTTGGKLKETGTAHWASPNLNATNETGFTALPGGSRYNGGYYIDKGTRAIWWSSTELNTLNAMYYNVYNDLPMISKFDYPKQGGFSIRCIKN